MLKGKSALAVQCSNTQDEQYAIFCGDKGLYHGNNKDGFTLLAVLENINLLDRPIKLYYYYPYICVTERYGLNAAVVNITTGHVLELAREDSHCDVSSYSVGFLKHNGRVLLVHQTGWNRLDITDLSTGWLLTPRQVTFSKDGNGTNYIDYFHSLLHVSPDGRHFLSNGWMWHPVDNIMCFETDGFLKEYEPSGQRIEYCRGYNWDRPCTFVGDDMFVIAADKDTIKCEEGVNPEELAAPPAYHQLLYYKLSEVKAHKYTFSGYEGYDTLHLAYSGWADCDVFNFDTGGDIDCGELYYRPEAGTLIALSAKGAFELALDGTILYFNPSIKLNAKNWDMRYNDNRAIPPEQWLKNWQYDTVRHQFYRINIDFIQIYSI